MSKIIISVLLLLVVSQTLCKEYWQCDAAGKFSCSQQQTCCRNKVSSTGWACFPTINGVCCSDGISVCPTNTICNLRDKRCDAKPLLFLADLNEEQKHIEPEDALVSAFGNDATDLAAGFLYGFKWFNNLPHQDECKFDQESDKIAEDIKEIINLIKSIKFNKLSTITDAIAKIVPIVKHDIDSIRKISTGCGAFADEIQKQFDGLSAYTKQPNYKTELAKHALYNIFSITSKIKEATSAVSAGKYFDAGKSFGELTNLIFFWNYKPAQVSVFLAVQGADTDKAVDFLKGVNDGFGFFAHAKGADKCKFEDKEIFDDIDAIIKLLKNLSFEHFEDSVQEIFKTVVDAGARFLQKIEECEDLEEDFERIGHALKKHVLASGYKQKLVFHLLTNLKSIGEYVSKINNALNHSEFRQSGNFTGEMIKTVFFWDFKLDN